MKVIIYGHARSGTTTLLQMVGEHPDIGESFFEPFRNGDELGFWKNKNDLHAFTQTLDYLFENRQVIKSLVTEIPQPYLGTFFNKADKVLLSSRKNMLRAAVSFCLGEQTKVWQTWMESANGYEELSLKALDLRRIQNLIRLYIKRIDFAEQVLKEREVDYRHVRYEDFFLSSDHNERLDELFGFLGLNLPQDLKQQLHKRMSEQRLNTEKTYLRIPNVYEIDRKLGNNKTGWLLNGGLQL